MSEYNKVLLLGTLAWLCIGMAVAQTPFKTRDYGRVTIFQLLPAMRRFPPDAETEASLRHPLGPAVWAAVTAFVCVTAVAIWPVLAARFVLQAVIKLWMAKRK